MDKLTIRVAIPIILAGIFAIIIFMAMRFNELDLSFYIVASLLAVYVFFFGLATGQNLSSPVKQLLDRATELSRGNLSSRVYLETKDEFAELAKVFNKIAEELEVSRDQEENVEKSVGIKVKAKTKELEEVISALEQKVENRTIELQRLMEESDRLQSDVKNKKDETVQLKMEVDNFKKKISK